MQPDRPLRDQRDLSIADLNHVSKYYLWTQKSVCLAYILRDIDLPGYKLHPYVNIIFRVKAGQSIEK